MLTGCRLGEIMTLKWDYVDLKARELRLPDSKTGAKIVHFGETAAKVLKGIEKLDDNPWVIPAGKKAPASPTCSIPGGASERKPASIMCAFTTFGTPTRAVPSLWEKACR